MERSLPTVETSLETLSSVVGKAADDLRQVRGVLDRERADISERNTSVSREIVGSSVKAIKELQKADEALKDVIRGLADRG
jgi:hypothetical protein